MTLDILIVVASHIAALAIPEVGKQPGKPAFAWAVQSTPFVGSRLLRAPGMSTICAQVCWHDKSSNSPASHMPCVLVQTEQ